MKRKDWTILLRDSDGLFTEMYSGARKRDVVSQARRDHAIAIVVTATPNKIFVYCGGTEWEVVCLDTR